MTLREKQSKFAGMLGRLLVKAEEIESPLVILCMYRGLSEQQVMVSTGKSKTLESKHLVGLAVDVAFLEDIMDDGKITWSIDKYTPLGLFWESFGGRWGGRFGDNPNTLKIEGWDAGHFELNIY